MAKYKLVVFFETKEKGTIDGLLEGSWLYDSNFNGAITSKSLTKVK